MSNSKEVSIVEGKRVLYLTLKKKWWDMIASGEKKEEYRETKAYWGNRLCNNSKQWLDGFVDYELIIFKNGYASDAPTLILKCEEIDFGFGKPEWGADPDKEYFVIKLGEILYNSNNTPQSKL